MDHSFQRYLLSKQSVDDRALNRGVLEALRGALPPGPLRVIEVGAGLGTMAARLLRWDVLRQAEYVLVDEMAENIQAARQWLPDWAARSGLAAEPDGPDGLRIRDGRRDLRLRLVQADVFDYLDASPAPAGLLIAHAFLDLLPMPDGLARLFSLLDPGGLAWLTINFDGLTSLEPPVDPDLDAHIEALYHRSMDERATGGDSRCGRHLFAHLTAIGAELLAAGPSDWVVHPRAGRYPQDEAFFLQFILEFFERSLSGHPQLDPAVFADWLGARRAQIERAELVYLAHQFDFLARRAQP